MVKRMVEENLIANNDFDTVKQAYDKHTYEPFNQIIDKPPLGVYEM